MINPVHPAFAQEQMLRTVTVTGQGTESLPATQARITLGVEVQGETAEAVQAEVARRSNAVLSLLQARNDVSKLQTAGLYLSPTYDYSNNTPRITGYTATNTVSFEVPSDQAGALMDEVVRSGATRIDGISFMADEAAIAEARQRAIEEAAQNAQVQADAVLSSLGFTRREIVGIQVNGAQAIPPIPLYGGERALQDAAASPTPIVGGEQEVQATVTLQISY
ncbi:hypothetical protein C7B76_19160 [filamentous cyanobacterium CCP2]|nr:hypothetical protein C7B76_19160 [filamentous cyanobacterium CCP2]